MNIKINGKEETLDNQKVTITELLKIKNVDMPDMVTVEHNGDILDREKFETTQVNDGDVIEFLYFMGGGDQG